MPPQSCTPAPNQTLPHMGRSSAEQLRHHQKSSATEISQLRESEGLILECEFPALHSRIDHSASSIPCADSDPVQARIRVSELPRRP